MKSPHTVDEFDFSLDDRLKRLRQIWKQFIVNADSEKNNKRPTKKTATAAAAVLANTDSTTTTPPTITPTSAESCENASSKEQRLSSSKKKLAIEPQILLEPLVDPSAVLPNIGVESETGQGLRCSIEKCGKLFRKFRLLQEHVKHYHPDVFDQVLNSTTTPVTTAPSTPATSPPSTFGHFNNACLSSPSVDVGATPDFTQTSQISTESKKRKSFSVDTPSVPDFDVSVKKRKLSLGFDEEDSIERPKKWSRAHERSRDRSRRGRPGRPGKKFSFSENSAASPINNNTSEMYDVVNRTRNDSIMSVSSSVAPSEDGDHDVASKASRVLPPTPPTFRLSKRRQAQLIGSGKKNSRRRTCLSLDESSMRGRRFRDDLQSMSPEVLLPTPSTSGYFPFPGGFAGGSSYPPSEVDTSVTSEHLTTEEVVNCDCRRKEEDGLMIQCDICLCWQHGLCLGIDDEDQVPEKHVCETCRNPPAGRSSAKFALDHDWLKEGKLPTAWRASHSSGEGSENAFKKLSELMADLANLNKVLHSLRVKLQVASQSNSGKVFMWSMLWDPPPSIQQQEPNEATSTAATSTAFDIGDNSFVDETESNFGGGKFNPQAVIDKLKFRLGEAATAAGGDPFSNITSPQFSNSSEFCSTTQQNFLNDNSLEQRDETLWPQYSLTFEQQQNSQAATSSSGVTGSTNQSSDISQTSPADQAFEASSSNEMPPKECEPITTNGMTGQDAENLGEFDPATFEEESRKTDLEHQQQDEDMNAKPSDDDIRQALEAAGEDQLDEVVGSGSGDEATFDPSLIPTFSEVAQLLPSVIEAMGSSGAGGSGSGSESPLPILPPPRRVIIQEPKRLDRDECRLNLLDHISGVQNELEIRLDSIETSLSKIIDESNCPLPQTPKTRSMLTMLLRDLSTARTLMWSLK